MRSSHGFAALASGVETVLVALYSYISALPTDELSWCEKRNLDRASFAFSLSATHDLTISRSHREQNA